MSGKKIIDGLREAIEKQHGWPEIPDTPEQRALVAKHNADIREKYPNLRPLPSPIGD